MILVTLLLTGLVAALALALEKQSALLAQCRKEISRLEGQLQQAREQRAAIDGLRRLAHDLNNVLGMVSGYSELMRRAMEPSHPMRGRVDNILKAIARAGDLIRELRDMGRHLDSAPSVEKPRPTAAEDRPTILLVEDEASLRDVLGEVLNEAGYRVLSAAAANEALAAAQKHRGPIHLMLTDVNLPGTSGPELAAQLQFMHAAARVLYMSGHTDEIIARRGPLDDGALLQKPFTPATLLDRVRGALVMTSEPAGASPLPV